MTEPPRDVPAPRLFPLFLRLEGRKVLVVGAGAVGTHKARELLAAGARLTVVAPEATAALTALATEGALVWEPRAFAAEDVDGAWLVVASTPDAHVQAAVAAAASARHVWLVAVDDVANTSAYYGAVVRRPPFLVAISSSGVAPALSRLLREILESALPGDTWVTAARALRADWKRRGVPMGDRFGELVRTFSERTSRAPTPQAPPSLKPED